MASVIEAIESEYIRDDLPQFATGDTVRVVVYVREGGRERQQAFEGVVIARRNRGLN